VIYIAPKSQKRIRAHLGIGMGGLPLFSLY